MAIIVTDHQLVRPSSVLQSLRLLIGVSPSVDTSTVRQSSKLILGVHVGSLLVIPQKVLVTSDFPTRQQQFAGVEHFCASELENPFLGSLAFFDGFSINFGVGFSGGALAGVRPDVLPLFVFIFFFPDLCFIIANIHDEVHLDAPLTLLILLLEPSINRFIFRAEIIEPVILLTELLVHRTMLPIDHMQLHRMPSLKFPTFFVIVKKTQFLIENFVSQIPIFF